MVEPWSGLAGFVVTLMLHASVLLGAAWLLERTGWLRDPAWAEAAWRGAMFGALLSATFSSAMPLLRPGLDDAATPTAATAASAALPPAARAGDAGGAVAIPARVPPVTPPTPLVGNGTIETTRLRVDSRAAQVAGSPLALPRPIVQMLALAWIAATLAWLVLCVVRLRALRRLQQAARCWPEADALQQSQARELALQLGLPRVALHRVPSLTSPVALPKHRVLLPEWSRQLTPSESRAMIAHELAHLARHDPRWRIAQHLALAPLALHPLVWFALHRLDALAERGADALAARTLGDGRALAECLARCVEQQLARPGSAPRFALAMAERPGAVVDRVQHLLEDDPMKTDLPSPRRTRLAIALGLVAALTLPTIVVTAFADGLLHGQSISVHVDDEGNERVTIAVREVGYALEAKMEGKIAFAPDERDVVGMAPGAELSIEETREGVTRELVVSPADRGTSRAYRVDGKPHDFDADAQAWFATTLPEIFRSSGVDADARSQRILAQSGTEGLLAEIGRIRSDYGRARYIGLLFKHAMLDPAQLSRALELMRDIDSDHELRQAIAQALESRTLDAAQQIQVLELVQAIGSDYERAELLVDTAGRFTLDAATFARWAEALDGIGSDYERRRALEALLRRDHDRDAAVRLAFDAARDIGSDYEKRQLLEQGIAAAQADPALRELYLSVAAGIGSDYECKEALLALLRGATIDAGFALALLDAIDGIGSGHERSEALVELAARMPADAAVIERYRASARRLSTHERGKAEAALDRLVVVR